MGENETLLSYSQPLFLIFEMLWSILYIVVYTYYTKKKRALQLESKWFLIQMIIFDRIRLGLS